MTPHAIPADLDPPTRLAALSALVSASLAEDPYGQVQRDIPRTLEALTAFLAALEALHAELQAPAALPGAWAEQGAATMAVLKDDVEPVLDGACRQPPPRPCSLGTRC